MPRFTTHPSPWTGFLRLAPLANVVISICVTVILAIAIYFGVSLGNPPEKPYTNPYKHDSRSPAALAFYLGLAPFLSLVHSLLTLTLHIIHRMSPLHALLSSLFWILAWAAVLSLWTICEIWGGYEAQAQPGCPATRFAVGTDFAGADYPLFFRVGFARIYVVGVVLVPYVVYMICACVAVHRARMERKRGVQKSVSSY